MRVGRGDDGWAQWLLQKGETIKVALVRFVISFWVSLCL